MATDPRSRARGKLVPKPPLPYISYRALRRVRNPLPAPKQCPYCDGPVELVANEAIYGRPFGDWPYAYHCAPCGAMVGLHPETDIPLGTLANRDLREARVTNKQLFHRIKEQMGFTRSSAYLWLARKMGIDPNECHFGWFDIETCKKAGDICRRNLK